MPRVGGGGFCSNKAAGFTEQRELDYRLAKEISILCMLLCMCIIDGMVTSGLMGLDAEKLEMSAKAEELMRQQYLVPRKSVQKLREMSRREGVSAGELARRAIEAYTSGNVLTEPEEELASRAELKDIHVQVRAALARIDASLAEIRASEQRLADGTLRAQVVAETRAWFDAHPDEAQGIVEFFAPQATA